MSEPRTDAKICGMGHSMKRKEDPRFIRGQGRYIDDHVLPGMLYMDIVRSPYAHARIKKIDTSKALKIPGVLAVIDGPTLAKYNLHWMPTLSSDTQMVLPIDEVMYQAQEVCAVIATERYIAADGVDAVEVEYEPLPVMVDPFKSLAPGAPILRKDKKDKKDNLAFHWEAGDKADTDRALAASDVVVSENVYLPRIHVASMETCGCISDFDTAQGKLTVYMTTQAPHAVRTVLALVAGHVGLSEEKIRIVSPDIGGGFGGKVPVYPGYVIAIAASGALAASIVLRPITLNTGSHFRSASAGPAQTMTSCPAAEISRDPACVWSLSAETCSARSSSTGLLSLIALTAPPRAMRFFCCARAARGASAERPRASAAARVRTARLRGIGSPVARSAQHSAGAAAVLDRRAGA